LRDGGGGRGAEPADGATTALLARMGAEPGSRRPRRRGWMCPFGGGGGGGRSGRAGGGFWLNMSSSPRHARRSWPPRVLLKWSEGEDGGCPTFWCFRWRLASRRLGRWARRWQGSVRNETKLRSKGQLGSCQRPWQSRSAQMELQGRLSVSGVARKNGVGVRLTALRLDSPVLALKLPDVAGLVL
jgi:hypothetical protein